MRKLRRKAPSCPSVSTEGSTVVYEVSGNHSCKSARDKSRIRLCPGPLISFAVLPYADAMIQPGREAELEYVDEYLFYYPAYLGRDSKRTWKGRVSGLLNVFEDQYPKS